MPRSFPAPLPAPFLAPFAASMAVAVAALLAGAPARAVGTETATAPPQPSETTTACPEGQLLDAATGACVAPRDSAMDDEALYRTARELAHAGRYAEAQEVLAAMSDPEDDRVLTYMGFTHRRMGNIAASRGFYMRALQKNPDNLMARAYLGQGYVDEGDMDAARAQLTEIRSRGGRGSWPELALRLAIERGSAPAY